MALEAEVLMKAQSSVINQEANVLPWDDFSLPKNMVAALNAASD